MVVLRDVTVDYGNGVTKELLDAAQPFLPMDEADGNHLRESAESFLKAIGNLLVGLGFEEDTQPFQFRSFPKEPPLRPLDQQGKGSP